MPAMSEPKSSNPESSPRTDMKRSEVRLTDTTQQVRLKPDTTHEVRLKPDTTHEVRPKPDPTYSQVHVKPDDTSEVRLKPDLTYVPSHDCKEDAMICERCGKAEMYRMHAVWRCPECGFKTDCCGW
jgi:hypothetical protein